jgi:hypothetical protein
MSPLVKMSLGRGNFLPQSAGHYRKREYLSMGVFL